MNTTRNFAEFSLWPADNFPGVEEAQILRGCKSHVTCHVTKN